MNEFTREQIEGFINAEVNSVPVEVIQAETKFVGERLLQAGISLNQSQIDALANSLQYVNKLDMKQSMISTVNLLTKLGVLNEV